jgi:hypothetical protein
LSSHSDHSPAHVHDYEYYLSHDIFAIATLILRGGEQARRPAKDTTKMYCFFSCTHSCRYIK